MLTLALRMVSFAFPIHGVKDGEVKMKIFLIGLAFLAAACAQSAEYLPPVADFGGAASNVVENNFLESEPAHSLAEDGYRYKTVKRFRLRHRRDVSELSNEYLPPAASAPEPSYSAPAYESAASYAAPSYSAPAEASYEVAASEPAHTLAADGYRYKTARRVRYRHRQRRRRDVSELSNEYLPPAASAPAPSYSAPAYESAASYAAPSYSAPAEASYEVAASEPAHTLAADGYRYKTVKRLRYRQRRRRDVSELSNEYLPPAASAPEPAYESAASYSAPSYSAPAASFDAGFDGAASEPAHTLAADGYRYKTARRVRYRHRQRRRRDVSELSNEYLPPAASAPAPSYSAPAYESAASYAAPSYSAPAEASYEVAASEPAHTLAADGYRYKTVKRLRYRQRRRRDVSELSNEYLPPAASAPEPAYESAASYSAPSYSAPAASFDAGFDGAASEPAHTLAADGYRYKTARRVRYRHRQRRRRDVSELSNEYLPPAASAPAPSYSAPAYESAASYAAPSYSAPAEASYEVAASEPAHTLAADGYRYKTVKRLRYRQRRRRDVSELSNEYLPPQASAPEPSYSAPAPSYEATSYDVAASEPAHTLANDGYRYKTVKRYRYRHRH